jgi:hypothetical protein
MLSLVIIHVSKPSNTKDTFALKKLRDKTENTYRDKGEAKIMVLKFLIEWPGAVASWL